ncbi:MAG: VOC family protein [Gemmatimonadota bacterium]
MPPALDHVFICTDDPRSAERALADFGLRFAQRVIHRGQGTANACAFFDNAYLELLWGHDNDELQSEVVESLALWERVRWRETGASPFGIALRPDGDVEVDTWAYKAPFLPAGASIPIVTPRSECHEPLVFLILGSQAPATLPLERRPPLEHRGRRRLLTGVTVFGPMPPRRSPGLDALCDLGVIAIRPAAEQHLELEWDSATCGELHDFRSVVPLVLRW